MQSFKIKYTTRIPLFEWNILSLNFAYFMRKNMFDPMVAVINHMSTRHWFRLFWAGWTIIFEEDASIVVLATLNRRSPCPQQQWLNLLPKISSSRSTEVATNERLTGKILQRPLGQTYFFSWSRQNLMIRCSTQMGGFSLCI